MKKSFSFLSFFSLFALCSIAFSCGTTMKIIGGLPSLNVYSQEEINENIQKLPTADNIVDLQLSDTLTENGIKIFIYESQFQSTYVYDSTSELLCYLGENSCRNNALNALEATSIDSVYKKCAATKTDTIFNPADLKQLLSKMISNQKVDLKSYKYTVVTFWNTDLEKGKIAENWGYFFNYFREEEDVLYLRIWSDLNEDWGLKKGSKARFKVRKVTRERGAYTLTLKDLPYK